MSLAIENIIDVMDYEGEEELELILSEFICQKNDEIQTFLKDKAIEFAKKKLSITYLVNDSETGDLLGYFTLAHKVLEVPALGLSNTVRRKMSRYSTLDNRNESYMVSAFLLAQFGKNYSVDEERRVSGAELMDCVDEVLKRIQHQIGGAIVYLDCEDEEKLITFYSDVAGYKQISERISERDQTKDLQFYKFIK